MELFRVIRLNIGKIILSRRSVKVRRKVSYSNINNIKSIGIVWDASVPKDFGVLTEFYHKMNERNINLIILGYYPGKELPNQYTALRYFSCIRKKELSYFYIPKSEEAEIFINEMFDVVIDINFEKLFPLTYISTLSRAGFKVGLSDSEFNCNTFDLMIELKKPVSLSDYLTNVIHYLEMINSGSTSEIDKPKI